LRPLGYDTEAILWLTGFFDLFHEGSKSLYPESSSVEQSFWSAFSASLPADLKHQHVAIELALHASVAVRANFNPMWAKALPTLIEYRIPLEYWVKVLRFNFKAGRLADSLITSEGCLTMLALAHC